MKPKLRVLICFTGKDYQAENAVWTREAADAAIVRISGRHRTILRRHTIPKELSQRGRHMRKNQVRNVIVHAPEGVDRAALAVQISRFHVAVIERRLGQLTCSPQQKAEVLERIISEIGNRLA